MWRRIGRIGLCVVCSALLGGFLLAIIMFWKLRPAYLHRSIPMQIGYGLGVGLGGAALGLIVCPIILGLGFAIGKSRLPRWVCFVLATTSVVMAYAGLTVLIQQSWLFQVSSSAFLSNLLSTIVTRTLTALPYGAASWLMSRIFLPVRPVSSPVTVF